jgi:hypothetical protein
MTEVCQALLAMGRHCLVPPTFPDGYCTSHHSKDLRLRRVYGVSLVQAQAILHAQHWKCPVCQKSLEDDAWVIDHSHRNRAVRGALDRNCNHRVVGRHEDGSLLISAGKYVNNPPAYAILGETAQTPKKKRRRKPPVPKN